MIIGLDLDNTIVSYDRLFFTEAVKAGLVTNDIEPSKTAVRDRLREEGNERAFTELQGRVYGAEMNSARPFPGVVPFVEAVRGAGSTVAIVSHRTRVPFLGPPFDLHESARNWINSNFDDALIPSGLVFLETTLGDKLRRVGSITCDVFVDDLPEVLMDPRFPSSTKRFWFNAHGAWPEQVDAEEFSEWDELLGMIGS